MATLSVQCRLITLGLLLVLSTTTVVVTAEVPSSVAVRQQSPDVEQIISQLEAKATNARGVWITKSSRQNVPAREWQTGLSGDGKYGGSWYWKSLASSPDPTAGLVLFNDVENAFVPPYGSENRMGGERFQYDTLRQWHVADYELGHYLLHMNLLPRQFIGALGGLKVIGEENVAGDGIVHLTSNPKEDAIARSDPAVRPSWGTGISTTNRIPTVDLYFSRQKQAIIKAIISDSGAGSLQTELTITGWDKFGTSNSWPSSLVGRMIVVSKGAAGTLQSKDIESPVLTAVDHFVPGKDALSDAIKQQVDATAFFLTPPLQLRTREFYLQSLSIREDLSDRVALAMLSFIQGDVQDGLGQWEHVDQKLDVNSKHRLNKIISGLAATALDHASQTFPSQSKEGRAACASLLNRFTTLDGEEFKSAAYGSVIAWDVMRRAADTRATVTKLGETLLPKFASLGNVFVLEKLVTLAESNKDNAVLLDPLFKTITDQPVPATGLTSSQQDYLIIACIRAGALDRAKTFLNALRWSGDGNEGGDDLAKLWTSAISAAMELGTGQDQALPKSIQIFHAFSEKVSSGDRTDQIYGDWLMTKTGVDWMNRRMTTEADKPQPIDFLKQTAKLEGAEKYWGDMIVQAATSSVFEPKKLLDKIGPVIHAYAEVFHDPAFESGLWVALSRNRQVAGKYLGIELEYLNKALASAPDDPARATAIVMIGNTYAHDREYLKGANAVEQALELVKNETIHQQLVEFVRELRARNLLTTGPSS